MSLPKRLEKEIDYLKGAIGILVALVAGITTWFVHIESNVNLLFKLTAILLFFIFLLSIIYLHIEIKKLLDKLEVTDD